MNRIVVIDDDLAILELVKINLELAGYEVFTAENGDKGYALIQQKQADLVVLDVMMPEVSGFTVAQRIRNNPKLQDIPILMLTALGMIDKKEEGFKSGADDYLVKPFEIKELLLRVKALLKRVKSLPPSLSQPEILTMEGITLLPEEVAIKIAEKKAELTPTEFDIIYYLLQKHGQIVETKELLEKIWGYSENDGIEMLRVHVRHLREKLERISDKKYIQTVYRKGYKLLPKGAN